ncbi:MAG TPA: hypothetical protein VHC49_05110, partial [Mycobacteriales bacterium]|nr:hypothetical protein [Mycobacteriales bacterium]
MAGTRVASRLVVTGVIGALVAFLSLAGLSALATEPFRSADETAHTAYAIEVGHGHLPTRQTEVSRDIPLQHGGKIYVASHPPLYYLLIAPPLTWGLERGTPLTGFYLARLETILMSLGTIALTAYLATVLFRGGRPDLAVAAAGLLATTGVFAFTSSFIYNDALSTFFSTALIAGTVLVLHRGLRPGPGLLVVLSGAAAVATRSSNAPLVVV